MKQDTDVLVVGGGAIGLAIARCLAQQRTRVTVIEKGRVGQEASWAAAGMLAPHCELDAHTPFYDMCRASLALYPAFVRALQEESGVDVDYRADGTLFPALDDDDRQALEQRHAHFSKVGVQVKYLTARDARRLEPNLSGSIQMALLFTEDHQVDNRKLLQALALSAQRAGAEVQEQTPVLKVLTEGERVVGVETSSARWHAHTVVNAAGCWARHLSGVPASGCPPVRPVRGQMIALDTTAVPPFRHVIYSKKSYLVPKSDGRLLIGATVEEAGYRKAVTTAGVMRLLHGALRLAPPLKDYPFACAWSGLRPATPDRYPILGPSGCDGLILATGHYRNGILLAPLTGALIADLILKHELPEWMRPFLLDRFHQSKATTL